jgi:hypothetical protein
MEIGEKPSVFNRIVESGSEKIMTNTLPIEKWGLTESADWWSAGQAARRQIYGTATEMMLDLAGVQAGSRVLDVAAGTVNAHGSSAGWSNGVRACDRRFR